MSAGFILSQPRGSAERSVRYCLHTPLTLVCGGCPIIPLLVHQNCVGVCGIVCCVAAVVGNSVAFCLGMLKYVVCLCSGCDVMDAVFSVCIVRCGAVGARVREV